MKPPCICRYFHAVTHHAVPAVNCYMEPVCDIQTEINRQAEGEMVTLRDGNQT